MQDGSTPKFSTPRCTTSSSEPLMRRLTMWLVPALALAACRPAADKGAERGTGDTTSAAAPASAGPVAIVTVLYNHPKDAAAFEKYYSGTHLPILFANKKEIG